MSGTSPSLRPTNVSVTVTLYQPDKGRIADVDSLNFGKAMEGKDSGVIVVRMFANGTRKIRNIKLGVVASSPQNPDGSGSANADGSVPAGNFGVEHSSVLSEKTALDNFFSGINFSELSTDVSNVSVDNLTDNSSEYVYLNVKMPAGLVSGYIRYKWFFDFA